jgi:MSHA biogenesis protein MshG
MPSFNYQARNRHGVLIQARIDAGSAEAAAAQLLEAGNTPIRISQASKQPDFMKELEKRLNNPRVKIQDLIMFTRQMSTLARAGVPIVRAINGLAENCKNPAMADALVEIAESLKSGRELSEALSRHPKIFSDLFVSVVEIGQDTGRLDESFVEIGRYLERELQTRKQIKTATRYPTLVIGAIVGAMVVINVFVIPAFAKLFSNLGAELPWATKLLLTTSNFTVDYWPVLIAVAAIIVFGVRAYLSTTLGRYTWDRYKLKIPGIGSILERATLARYARSVSMTFKSGVPVIQALAALGKTLGNEYIADRIMGMRQRIERGETMTRAASVAGVFTPLVIQMMAVGEESGAVAEMHEQIAEAYEAEVDYDLKHLSDVIEPILIVAIGGMVFILALGVYLPMWEMGGAAQGR